MSSNKFKKPFKGSTSARFVKNKQKQTTMKSEFRAGNTNQGAFGDNISKLEMVKKIDELDSIMGFDRLQNTDKPRRGWMVNMHPCTIASDDYLAGYSGVDYYFLDEEGGSFKATLQFDPYFFLTTEEDHEHEVEETLKKELESSNLKSISYLKKEDLSLPNHLVGLKRSLLKLSFHNVSDLLIARRILAPLIKENQLEFEKREIYAHLELDVVNPLRYIRDIREYDVPYHVRVAIDEELRVGKWYNVSVKNQKTIIIEDKEKIAFADPVVLAFDIETTKPPLKFPDASTDQIMMISYMIDGEGFLITNREIISEDIDDFEYTPKPEYPGCFTVFNEMDEKAVLERFFEHVRDVKPTVIATYNGDFFDWPFIEKRTSMHGMDLFDEIGFAKDMEGEYKSKYCAHLDCYRWVKRDSYLPQGSQNLKAVTTAKLGYNPTELDPELMTPYAYEKPQLLSEYSVSDAVATYYLYYKYVHPFIFSLCTIIPLNPDETLRKGTGTLCEMLLMVQAYQNNILLPNKHADPIERFYEGHLLESETYVGGHVESLEAGVFRSDIPCSFKVDPTAIDELIQELHESLKFFIEVESKKEMADIENYDEVYEDIKAQLLELSQNPERTENPLIYHVDVASMYPNIMTTNRLQPDSMKTEEDCAACDFNRPQKNCDRRLPWSWRGEYSPASEQDYNLVKRRLQGEKFPARHKGMPERTFEELSYPEQAAHIKRELNVYSRKSYNRVKQTTTTERISIVCQRENPFYVNTVRAFRDRRYEFKTLAKVWKGKSSKLSGHEKDEASKMVVLYDSMQLAHKVILNSFYGYVMRKGSRWYSMEMAGITCLTGAHIIQMARSLVERIGRPLELDTDGIWCILPKSFPENFYLKCKDGKKLFVEYPCSMLNYRVHQKYTNHQYQDLVDPENFKYKTRSDNSIFFEVDGPYRAMILPTSKEEGKGLKKRYAVFNDDGSLAELKGFEIKRRGELQLIKNFQSDIFKLFLEGNDLVSCYGAVAVVANNWLDVLDTKGGQLEDEDLIELICENRSMSKCLDEYDGQKSSSITTAKRLGEFLGEEMVKDAGLACKYIISAKPIGAPVSDRAIPVSIFSSEKKEFYLRKWLKDERLSDFDPRSVLDWDYYRERLASVVQKIISIPAALQGIKNPVPRVPHPDWLNKKIAIEEDSKKQQTISKFFKVSSKSQNAKKMIEDIEDFGAKAEVKTARVLSKGRKRRLQPDHVESEEIEMQNQLLKGDCPPMTEYTNFLQYQKAKWRRQEKEKLERQRLFGSSSHTSQRATVGGMIRKQAANLAGVEWEILQYQQEEQGVVKVYVSAANKVHTFRFRIPKTFYVTFKVEPSQNKLASIKQCIVEKSAAILPNGHDATHLYKFEMPEEVYEQEIRNADSILQDSSVLGIYETKINCVDRAVINLGNSVKFDDTQVGALGRGLRNGFNLKDLNLVDNTNYLKRFSMDILYLLHIVTNSYEFFGVFKSWEPEAKIFVLKPSTSAQELPSMNKIYKDMFESKKEKLGKLYSTINYADSCQFETSYYLSESKLMKKLQGYINKIQEERSSKVLFTVQSPRQLSITTDLPTVKMGISELSLPAIGWQQLICKRLINHWFTLAKWIKNLISLSRFGNIPICNLQVEKTEYLIDIEYARRLSNNSIVLWWSPSTLPDHGGFEMDNNMNDTFYFPVINNPHIYNTACLDIDVGNLIINTILTSSLLNEAEGSDLADDSVIFDSNNGGATMAEDSFSAPALSILRGMVRNWWDEALQSNINADAVMNGLVAWVQRKESNLYDKSLHYHVHNLACKAFYQILREFKKMGASVIHGSRNKIVVQTNKPTVDNSYAIGQHFVRAIRQKSLFSFLDLKVSRYWDVLVWMDEYNFGGRSCNEIIEADEQVLNLSSNWQLKEYLPVIFQTEFEDWWIIFLNSLVEEKNNILSTTQRATQLARLKKEEQLNDTVIDSFKKPFLSRMEKLLKRQNESILNPELKREYEFPKKAGSHLTLTNPTLELAKYLLEIFGLSPQRSVEVRILRKDLLALFDIREFSPEGQFQYPVTSLKIPSVICDYCNYIRDIDVCKDMDITSCSLCHKKYNTVAIEELLISELYKLIASYHSQDLQCTKCKRVKGNDLLLHCECAGEWAETISSQFIETRLQVFERIAEYHNLQLLRGAIESGV